MSEVKRHAPLLEESILSIQALAGEVSQTVTELPEDVFRWKPAENIWSIAEILGHVEEAAPYWAGEIQRVIANPGTQWGRNHHDEARLAAVAAASQRSTRDVIAGFGQAANAVVSALRTLREKDLQIESPSRNPRWGVKPMSFVLDHLIVSHLRGHRDQIMRNLSQFAAQAGELKR
ncbi:MAG TPA: DinB family protein [Candidatus Acidoferrales bacterium]|jgi:uncharacterized damage-inducible protein DinB|nr:DinB family protein [Candidatus Acidoferrales bacterium]